MNVISHPPELGVNEPCLVIRKQQLLSFIYKDDAYKRMTSLVYTIIFLSMIALKKGQHK